MKVMLVLPPSRFATKEILGITSPPLGLAYLASSLENEGYKVKIIDAPTLNWKMDDVQLEIENFKPQLVGITSTTPTIYDAYEVAEITKKIDLEITVVVGGPHVSFASFTTLDECSSIDIVFYLRPKFIWQQIRRKDFFLFKESL